MIINFNALTHRLYFNGAFQILIVYISMVLFKVVYNTMHLSHIFYPFFKDVLEVTFLKRFLKIAFVFFINSSKDEKSFIRKCVFTLDSSYYLPVISKKVLRELPFIPIWGVLKLIANKHFSFSVSFTNVWITRNIFFSELLSNERLWQ